MSSEYEAYMIENEFKNGQDIIDFNFVNYTRKLMNNYMNNIEEKMKKEDMDDIENLLYELECYFTEYKLAVKEYKKESR